MLQRPIITAFIITLGLLFSQCSFADGKVIKGDGHVVTTTHPVDDFEAIELQGAFNNVVLVRGNDLVITMETDENLQDLYTIEVTNGVLSISSERETILNPTRMDLTIVYPRLHSLRIGGACKLSSDGKVVAESFTLDISGAADLELEVDARSMRTQVSGAGNLNLHGQAGTHSIRLSGASNLDAKDLITDETSISLSGAGSATVHAATRLQASLSGIGKITYHGNPAETVIDKSGLGSVRSAN